MEEQAKKKTCSKCNVEKELGEFYVESFKNGKLRSACKECNKQYRQDNKEIISERKKQRYQNNKEEVLEKQKQYRQDNKEIISERNKQRYQNNRKKVLERKKQIHKNNPLRSMLKSARARAKQFGREFNIREEDIQLPEYCPILGIKLETSNGQASHNSYSLDRIDSSKGYVKGNIEVISFRANTLKKDATLEELKKLVEYIEKQESLKNS